MYSFSIFRAIAAVLLFLLITRISFSQGELKLVLVNNPPVNKEKLRVFLDEISMVGRTELIESRTEMPGQVNLIRRLVPKAGTSNTNDQKFRLVSEPDGIKIYADREQGFYNGLSYLLHKWGFRF